MEYNDPSEAIARPNHTTTVNAYQEEYKKLSQLIKALPVVHLIGYFIKGDKDDV